MVGIRSKYDKMKQLHFERTKYKFVSVIKNFKTFQKDLRDFLTDDSLKNQDICVGATYLVFDIRDFMKNRKTPSMMKLIGYLTILNDNISLNQKLKEEFIAKGINYRSLPALKIGRLCVDDRYHGRGIGKFLLAFGVQRACNLNHHSACRFVTIDAKRNKDKKKDSLHFYAKYGFQVLEHKSKTKDELIKQTSGATPMFLDIHQLVKQCTKVVTLK